MGDAAMNIQTQYGHPQAVASGDAQDSVPPRVAVIAGPLSRVIQ